MLQLFTSHRRLLITVFFFMGGISLFFRGLSLHQRYERQISHFHAPITMTLTEFTQAQPKEGWFRITDTIFFADEAVYTMYASADKDDKIKQVFVPVYDATQEASAPLILISKDLTIRHFLIEMFNLGITQRVRNSHTTGIDPSPSQRMNTEEFKRWLTRNEKRLIYTRTIEGMVRPIEELNRKDRKLCHSLMYDSLAATVSPNAILLEEGITPQTDNNGWPPLLIGAAWTLVSGGIVVFLTFPSITRWKEGRTGDNALADASTRSQSTRRSFKE